VEHIQKPFHIDAALLDAGYWEQALDFALAMIEKNIPAFSEGYPAPASVGNVYPVIPNTEWTSSFWNGMLWQAYQYTGDEQYRKAAERTLADYQNRLEKRIETNTHDLGFLYILSCKAEYLLTGNLEAKKTALEAADLLMVRYNEPAGILQAWGDLDNPLEKGRIIVDCLMNIPLLFWASDETGESHYREAAVRHLKASRTYLFREDDSTYHTYYFDTETGAPLRGTTAQGYSDSSCWARGQAWAIYGLCLNYRYESDPLLLYDAKRMANYFINRLPEDNVPYWDIVFTSGDEERDSSSASIAACALLELATLLPVVDKDRQVYERVALSMMKSLADSYTSKDEPLSNGILLHAVYGKPFGKGVDECTIWGDYFYVEALVRILRNRPLFW